MKRIPSGIEVEVLDKNAICSVGETLCISKLSWLAKVGFVRTHKGLYVIEDSGLMSQRPLKGRNSWPIDLYKKKNGHTMAFDCPLVVVNIDLLNIENFTVREKVPLEIFIHSGCNYETHYEMCLNQLRKAMK